MRAITDLGPSKLHDDEQAVVREAADSLLFADEEPDVRRALAELHELADRLVEAERLSSEAVEQLVRDVEACGPAVIA